MCWLATMKRKTQDSVLCIIAQNISNSLLRKNIYCIQRKIIHSGYAQLVVLLPTSYVYTALSFSFLFRCGLLPFGGLMDFFSCATSAPYVAINLKLIHHREAMPVYNNIEVLYFYIKKSFRYI